MDVEKKLVGVTFFQEFVLFSERLNMKMHSNPISKKNVTAEYKRREKKNPISLKTMHRNTPSSNTLFHKNVKNIG
jgi:hypothetical protein